jgi:hypothetical protein
VEIYEPAMLVDVDESEMNLTLITAADALPGASMEGVVPRNQGPTPR